MTDKKSIGVLIFDEFELLDVFGPLEMFGLMKECLTVHLVSEAKGVVSSSAGPRSVADHCFADGHKYDIVVVPGGIGTRTLVNNETILRWIRQQSQTAEYVTSVCTGSALLAKAGVLNGKRATTNKLAFEWATSQSDSVLWVREARWVIDGRFMTSSGVSAGIDMSLSLLATLYGKEIAQKVAVLAEYQWNEDAKHDPFARLY